MKYIEITTSQNVTVQYSLASPWERALALVADVVVMTVVSLLVWGLESLILGGAAAGIALYFTVFPFVLLYSLAFEQLNNGQSLGKKLLKIRVIRMDGEQASFFDYLMRWIFRALDIYFSMGGVAVLSSISSHHSQRPGDVLANTVVVNIGKTDRMRLENLLRLNKKSDYKVVYPQVARLPEEAMLIVKETMTKRLKLDNDAHNEAMDLLVKKLTTELQIKAPANKDAFLKTLLKDYILLTR